MSHPVAVLPMESNRFLMREPSSLSVRSTNTDAVALAMASAYSKLESKMAQNEENIRKEDEDGRVLFQPEEPDDIDDDEEEEEDMKGIGEVKNKICDACLRKQRVHFEAPVDSKTRASSLEDMLQQIGAKSVGNAGPFALGGPMQLCGMSQFGLGCSCGMGSPFYGSADPSMGTFVGSANSANSGVDSYANPGQEANPNGFIPSNAGSFHPVGSEPCGPGVPIYSPTPMGYSMPPSTFSAYPMSIVPSPFNLLGWLASPWIPNPLSSMFNCGFPCGTPYMSCGVQAGVPSAQFNCNATSTQTPATPCKLCGQCFPSESTDFSKLRRADGALPVSVQEEEINTKRKNYREKQIPSPDGRTISSRELVNEEEVYTNRRDIFYENDKHHELAERSATRHSGGDFAATAESKSNYPAMRTSPTQSRDSPNPDHELEDDDLDDDTSEDEDVQAEDVQVEDVKGVVSATDMKTTHYSISAGSEDDRDYLDALDLPVGDREVANRVSSTDHSLQMRTPSSRMSASRLMTETATTRTVRSPCPSYMRPQMANCLQPSNLQMYGYVQSPLKVQSCSSEPMGLELPNQESTAAITNTTMSMHAPRTCVIPPSPESVVSCDSLMEGTMAWRADSQSPPILDAISKISDIDGTETEFQVVQADTTEGEEEEYEEIEAADDGKAESQLFGPFEMPLLDDASDALMVRNTDKDMFMSDVRPVPLESGDAVAGDCLEEVTDRLPAAGEAKQKNAGVITASVTAIPISNLWTPTSHPCSKIHLLEVVSDPCDDIKRSEYCLTS